MLNNKTIAIVACSDGIKKNWTERFGNLIEIIKSMDIKVKFSKHIFEIEDGFSGTGEQRAQELNQFYMDEEVDAIFDISGGNISNETIEYIDFELIKSSNKKFYGYSDLSTIINSIYTKTGKSSGLYQIRNLVYADQDKQIEYFKDSIIGQGKKLYSFDYDFYRGESMEGVVVGGNMRCLLKLAGTEYFPDFQDKLLFIEGLGGLTLQIASMLVQLRMLGVFSKVAGVIVGNFTDMEEAKLGDKLMEMVLTYVPEDVPVARTLEIGHQVDSKAIMIGDYIKL